MGSYFAFTTRTVPGHLLHSGASRNRNTIALVACRLFPAVWCLRRRDRDCRPRNTIADACRGLTRRMVMVNADDTSIRRTYSEQ